MNDKRLSYLISWAIHLFIIALFLFFTYDTPLHNIPRNFQIVGIFSGGVSGKKSIKKGLANNYVPKKIDLPKSISKSLDKKISSSPQKILAKNNVVKKQIEEQKAQRNAIAKELPIGVVKQYVLLIKKKDRKAVAFAHKEACSECGFRLRPQLLLELESGTQTKVCENCGRFLVGSPKTDE